MECHEQMKDRRWNCSTVETGSNIFGKVAERIGSRESAFVYAISSAGVVHSIARACSSGNLTNCGCDPIKRGSYNDTEGEFTWQGCGSFIGYSMKLGKRFIDSKEGDATDSRALMNLQNNRVGRRAVKKCTKKLCKCHGVSGSCAVRSCWRSLKPFSEVGRFLKEQYDGAVQVTLKQPGALVTYKNFKPFTRFDLVYFEHSPDYCLEDKTVEKTSLHWAAAVNNVEAVQVLLAHGANRDAQDVKDETPLFLAAREGSYAAAKILLGHFANRDITDHMDRLPRDVAFERKHLDIVKLLDEYVPSPQMNVPTNGPMGSPGMMSSSGMLGSTKPVKPKKRPKLNTIAGLPLKERESLVPDPSIRRKASVKKRKEPPPMLMQGIDGSVSLSPVDSLESPRTTSYLEGTPPPLEPLYNGMSHRNLMNIDNNCTLNNKQPPSYEDCINAHSNIWCNGHGCPEHGTWQFYW